VFKMSKFKWIAILCIIGLLILPLGLFVASPKLNPLLNLVTTLTGEGAGDKMTLGSFSFVASDQDTLTLKIELGINNTDGPEMLFPAVNLTFNYGSDHLGDGWINPEVAIPSGAVTMVPIYAKMHKGEAFNKFLFSLIGGGLSLSIAGGQAFVFNNFGGYSEVLTIPLPSIPLPAVDLGGASFWPPTIHKVDRGTITADTPVDITANVTDRGGGVKEVILSWNCNGTGWVNTTMTGLPMKPIMGGYSNSAGTGMKSVFPHYPDSPILTACPGVFGIVHGQIPGASVGSAIQYCLYVIDDFNYVTLVPSTAPTQTFGADADGIDLVNTFFNYTVSAIPRSNFTAVWLPSAGGAEAGGLADMLNSLAAQGIDIFGAIMAGSSLLSGPLSAETLINIILPLIEYFEVKGVNPFEIVDQLLGFSGGLLPPLGTDPNPHINSNTSVALDLLAEGGISLTELITVLDVNLTKVVDVLGNSVRAPIAGYATLTEAFGTLLNKTFWDPALNATFFNFLSANDLFYLNQSLIVWRHNADDTWTNLTAQNFNIDGDANVEYYFGSSLAPDLLGSLQPGSNFTIIDLDIPTAASPAIAGKYQWEYYNGSWEILPILADKTDNLTTSGRIFFNPPFSMQTLAVNSVTTTWIRLKILAPINATTISACDYSVDYIPYYFTKINVDMLGRANTQMIPGEMDSFLNLMRSLNETPSYGMTIWTLLSHRGIQYSQFVQLIGGELATMEEPIIEDQILTTTSPTMALIVYGILAFAIIAGARGRKGAYAVSPLRVKRWYDTQLVTPSSKGREELEKYKLK
jgi:hypothetical protein